MNKVDDNTVNMIRWLRNRTGGAPDKEVARIVFNEINTELDIDIDCEIRTDPPLLKYEDLENQIVISVTAHGRSIVVWNLKMSEWYYEVFDIGYPHFIDDAVSLIQKLRLDTKTPIYAGIVDKIFK